MMLPCFKLWKFYPKVCLPLIKDTQQITVKLESALQLEKTLYMLGIEPGFYSLTVRSLQMLLTDVCHLLMAFVAMQISP